MVSGKKRRLQRIFRDDGRTVIVPMDHGFTLGPVTGLDNIQKTIDGLEKGGVDAIVVHKGIAANIDTKRVGLIIHLNGSTDISSDQNRKLQVCTVDEAIALGADGVSMHVNVGAASEGEMLMDLGMASAACSDFGIPLLAMMYPRGPAIKNSNDVALVKHVSRIGAELGADIVKTNYTGSVESFQEVVQGCPVPVVIAGGPKINTEEDVLRMVLGSIRAGGVGVSLGRNIFQHKNPEAMAKAVGAIVHKGATIDMALRELR
ncbi:2-amino-3,7-dideoxy-D-threo-hept-6-ulosonate synthase [Candidatus Bathyarchaeota archaeon]|nr:2-amino-3,7-dideoxy-D-threo-hept-6-ulosonate synthase [Candidatus Bathyarchaeota archaeon]